MVVVDDLWDYFSENREALASNYHMIASNTRNGCEIEVYLTEENGFPYFSIEVDGKQIMETGTVSSLDATMTYESLLSRFVFPNSPKEPAKDGYPADEDEYDEDEPDDDDFRLEEIRCAAEDFLQVLLENHPEEFGIGDDEMDAIVSAIEQHLCDEYGISVRHPTDVDGVVIQYPFGDPDEDDGQEKLPL